MLIQRDATIFLLANALALCIGQNNLRLEILDHMI